MLLCEGMEISNKSFIILSPINSSVVTAGLYLQYLRWLKSMDCAQKGNDMNIWDEVQLIYIMSYTTQLVVSLE